MKRHRWKSRSKRSRDGDSVSLFPFMAVLISTMGALILLLVVFARQARLQAAQTTVAQIAKAAQLQKDLERARGMAAWEKDELIKSREKTDAQLAQARLALGHIEDHTRRLGEEFSQLESDWAELDRYETEGGQRHELAQAQLAKIESQLDLARRQLEQTRDRAKLGEQSYAIVPYEGSNGTRRRPIYIECRSDSVVLQPEGIVLTAADFVGPNGPSNPLEVALRAIREHIQRTENALNGEQPIEPYPLLLVRPSGIEAYAHARAAMQSWGSDFGYELIEDDWKIDFDEPDPELARQVAEAVARARQKLANLARAERGLRGGYQAPTYMAKPHGGGVMRIGGHDYEAGDTGQPSSGSAWGRTTPSQPGPSENQAGGNASPNGTIDPRIANDRGRSPVSRRNPLDPSIDNANIDKSETPAGTNSGRNPLRPNEQRKPSMYGHSGIGRGESSGVDGAVGSKAENASTANGSAGRPGEWMPQSASGEASRSNGPPGESSASPLAGVRGKNWALPDAAHGSVGITRPIRVNCYPDRLELLPKANRSPAQIVSLGDRTEDTLDTFISAVWDHMKSWGIAGRGMYWQPILDIRVAPGAERRVADLEKLLDRSGLAVKRREGSELKNEN